MRKEFLRNFLAAFGFFLLMFLFTAFVLPIGIDRELHRRDAVHQYNVKNGWVSK